MMELAFFMSVRPRTQELACRVSKVARAIVEFLPIDRRWNGGDYSGLLQDAGRSTQRIGR